MSDYIHTHPYVLVRPYGKLVVCHLVNHECADVFAAQLMLWKLSRVLCRMLTGCFCYATCTTAKEMLPPGTIQIDESFGEVTSRVPDRGSVSSECRTKVPTKESILWGEGEIRLGAVEQLTEHGERASEQHTIPTYDTCGYNRPF